MCIGTALLFECAVALLAGFALLLWLFAPLKFFGLCLLALAPLVAWPIWAGAWSSSWTRWLQLVATGSVAGVHAILGGIALKRALDGFQSQATMGTPEWEIAGWLFVTAVAVLVLGAMCMAIPTPIPRPPLIALTVVMLVAGVAALTAAGVAATGDACDKFRLTNAGWRAALRAPDPTGVTSDGEQMAAAIERCHSVNGKSRDEVRLLLGSPAHRDGDGWHWPVGTTNDGIGPGDARELTVSFGRDGRATALDQTQESD